MQAPKTPDTSATPDRAQSPRPTDAARCTISLCVWCPHKDLRIKTLLARYPGVSISHGICRSCMEKELAKIAIDLKF